MIEIIPSLITGIFVFVFLPFIILSFPTFLLIKIVPNVFVINLNQYFKSNSLIYVKNVNSAYTKINEIMLEKIYFKLKDGNKFVLNLYLKNNDFLEEDDKKITVKIPKFDDILLHIDNKKIKRKLNSGLFTNRRFLRLDEETKNVERIFKNCEEMKFIIRIYYHSFLKRNRIKKFRIRIRKRPKPK